MKGDDSLGFRHKSLIHLKFSDTGNTYYGTSGVKHLTLKSLWSEEGYYYYNFKHVNEYMLYIIFVCLFFYISSGKANYFYQCSM